MFLQKFSLPFVIRQFASLPVSTYTRHTGSHGHVHAGGLVLDKTAILVSDDVIHL